jgi:hypothetical protein
MRHGPAMPSELPLTYSFQARPVGNPVQFRLEERRLTVDSGRRVDEVNLADVVRVRLTLEPQSLGYFSLSAKLWLANRRTLTIGSLTWAGMIRAERQDAAYGRFTRELLARIARANPQVELQAGKSPLAWWALALVAGVSLVAIVLFVLRAAAAGQGVAALVGLAVVGMGAWQMVPLIRSNRPRPLVATAPPPDLVP